MYKNIECDENHKKVLIPKNIYTKLKMLGAIATMSVLAVSFSGCDGIKSDVKQIPIPETTTSYTQAKEYNEETSNDKIESKEETTITEANKKDYAEQVVHTNVDEER